MSDLDLAAYERPKCPVHKIPDCSALLNGCSLPSYIAGQNAAIVAEVRELRAQVERVDALALGWQEHSLPGMTEWDFGDAVRAALRGDAS